MRYITQLIDKRIPLTLVLEANTDDELLIDKHQDFLHYPPAQVAGTVSFKILFALLAIENRFFQKQPLLEKHLNHKFTGLETEFAQSPPKKSLTYFLGENPLSVMLANLTAQTIAIWQQHLFITERVNFLSSVIDKKAITET